jgi:hypothetical protein
LSRLAEHEGQLLLAHSAHALLRIGHDVFLVELHGSRERGLRLPYEACSSPAFQFNRQRLAHMAGLLRRTV